MESKLENMKIGYKVRAIVSSKSKNEDEISLKQNDSFTKLEHEVEPGWSRGEKDDVVGLFPTGSVVSQNSQKENLLENEKTLQKRTEKEEIKIATDTKPRIRFRNLNLVR